MEALRYGVIFAAALFSPIGIDLYLGVSPLLAQTTGWSAEWVFSFFLMGIALGHLFSGRIYDRYGPGRTLLAAVAIGVLSGILQLMSADMYLFFSSRLLQGVSAALFIVFSTTYIKEVVDGEHLGKHYGRLNGVMNVIPATFPAIGLAAWSPDHALSWWGLSLIWIALCILPAIMAKQANVPMTSANLRHQSETREETQDRQRPFYLFAGLAISSLMGLFMYCALVFPVLTLHYGLSPSTVALYFAGNGLIMLCVGTAAGKLFSSPASALKVSALLSVLSGVVLVLPTEWMAGAMSFMVSCTLFCIAFIPMISNSHAYAMQYVLRDAGKANGFIAWWQMVMGAAATALLSLFLVTTQLWLLALVFGVLSLYTYWLHRRVSYDQFSSCRADTSVI